ncbi:phage tail protein [Salmonella enterica subsp. enterica serovar Poona]|nr:phage tail protein [Salmonella enterica subsp. enterica serovar Poona]
MELKNISRYYPDDMPYGDGVQYFKSEDGLDFYESQDKFTKKYKLCIEPDTGIIRSASEDVTTLYPAGFTIVETDALPDGFDILGEWVWNGEEVIRQGVIADVARAQKHDEINQWRNDQENADYTFTFNNHRWDYGKATQERLSLSVQMARQNKLPDGFFWTDADNNDVPMTSGELLNLSDAIDQVMFTKGMQIHVRQRQMKEDIDKLISAQDIVNYKVGWPEKNTA